MNSNTVAGRLESSTFSGINGEYAVKSTETGAAGSRYETFAKRIFARKFNLVPTARVQLPRHAVNLQSRIPASAGNAVRRRRHIVRAVLRVYVAPAAEILEMDIARFDAMRVLIKNVPQP